MYYLYCIYTVFILYFHFDKEPTWFENVNKKKIQNSKFNLWKHPYTAYKEHYITK